MLIWEQCACKPTDERWKSKKRIQRWIQGNVAHILDIWWISNERVQAELYKKAIEVRHGKESSPWAPRDGQCHKRVGISNVHPFINNIHPTRAMNPIPFQEQAVLPEAPRATNPSSKYNLKRLEYTTPLSYPISWISLDLLPISNYSINSVKASEPSSNGSPAAARRSFLISAHFFVSRSCSSSCGVRWAWLCGCWETRFSFAPSDDIMRCVGFAR